MAGIFGSRARGWNEAHIPDDLFPLGDGHRGARGPVVVVPSLGPGPFGGLGDILETTTTSEDDSWTAATSVRTTAAVMATSATDVANAEQQLANGSSSSSSGGSSVLQPDGIGLLDLSNRTMQKIDLNVLWRFLEEMDMRSKTADLKNVGINEVATPAQPPSGNDPNDSTAELVVMQAVLLCILIIVSLVWAICCRRKCVTEEPLVTEVIALARKISGASSHDLPPSYSKVDMTQEGLTLDDHLNPPPNYDRAADLALDVRPASRRSRSSLQGSLSSGSSGVYFRAGSAAGSEGSAGSGPDGERPGEDREEDKITVLEDDLDEDYITMASGGSPGGSPPVRTHPRLCRGGHSRRGAVLRTLAKMGNDVVNVVDDVDNDGVMGSHRVCIENEVVPSHKVSNASSIGSFSSGESSRKSSKVTFTPGLIEGPTSRKVSSQSLPLVSVLVKGDRKRSAASEGANSRKVSLDVEEATKDDVRTTPDRCRGAGPGGRRTPHEAAPTSRSALNSSEELKAKLDKVCRSGDPAVAAAAAAPSPADFAVASAVNLKGGDSNNNNDSSATDLNRKPIMI